MQQRRTMACPNPPATLTYQWVLVSGPGSVSLTSTTNPSTVASFTSSFTYLWTQTAGTTVSLDDATVAQPTFTAPTRLVPQGPETLTFQVLITDAEGGTHTDTVDIVITPSNIDPTANAGPDQSVQDQDLVTLDATASSDTDGTVDTYAWSQTAGTGVTLSDTAASQPTFTAPNVDPDETLTFELEVTDNRGWHTHRYSRYRCGCEYATDIDTHRQQIRRRG